MKELLEEIQKTSQHAIRAQLEKQNKRLDEMPTKDDVEKILCKLLQKMPDEDEMESAMTKRLDDLEGLIQMISENERKHKTG